MTSISIQVPKSLCVPQTAHEAWSTERPWRPPAAAKILVVEDDEDLRDGLTLWLRHQGFDAYSARDGAGGLRAIEEIEPDLMVLDLGLPRMHGFKVLHQLRHRPVAAPRTIVLTAASSDDVVQRAFSSGADEVLTKPANPERLLQIIDELLQP